MLRALDVTTSIASTVLRLGAGRKVGAVGKRPETPLELYEFEACPYCRKVREALSILDLDILIYPCPKGGHRFREEVKKRGGKAQFPYLIDPNTGVEMYESSDIVAYLFEHYGVGKPPVWFKVEPINTLLGSIASVVRGAAGTYYRKAERPEKQLTLYSFEASPFCRIVRERLTTLEIPYMLRNIAQGSVKRPRFVERTGRMMVPFLVDSNTGTALFESASIVAYLEETYRR
jgi:glutathione S-transferase